MEANMRKSAIIGIALAITAFISGTIIAAGHRTSSVTATRIDPAAITLKAGVLPVVQVDEPF
jgi:hypothetical protein